MQRETEKGALLCANLPARRPFGESQFVLSSYCFPQELSSGQETPPLARSCQPRAETMTIIHAPGWREQERVQRRFKFLLGEFEEVCTNEKGAATIPDRLVFIHQKLKEAGLDGEESLLDLSNTLHRLTQDIAGRASAAGMEPPQCSEIWVMYLMTRQKGNVGRLV